MANHSNMRHFPEFGMDCPVTSFKLGKDCTVTWNIGGLCEIRIYRQSVNRFEIAVVPPSDGSNAQKIIIPGVPAGMARAGSSIIIPRSGDVVR